MKRFLPMTPATTGPELMPMRIGRPSDSARFAHLQGEASHGLRVVGPRLGNAGDRHVAGAHGLDLLDPPLFRQFVESGEHVVEQRHEFPGRQALRAGVEVHQVGEQDRDAGKGVGKRAAPAAQPARDGAGQHRLEDDLEPSIDVGEPTLGGRDVADEQLRHRERDGEDGEERHVAGEHARVARRRRTVRAAQATPARGRRRAAGTARRSPRAPNAVRSRR